MKEDKTHHTELETLPEQTALMPIRRQSFVLRVWVDSRGQMRGYLSDVRTGVRHPFKEPSELPPLLSSILKNIHESDDR